MKPYIEYKNKWYDLENLPNEKWLPVKNYVGLYEVSNYGRVKSLGNGIRNSKKKILIPSKNTCGYLCVRLCKNGIPKTLKVHRLVSTSFLPNWFNEKEINHKDENKQNNHVDNLEWCDRKYNVNYGTCIKRRSEKITTNGKCSKPVLQFTLSGDFVAEYPSTKEVERQFGYDCGNISKCCNGKYKQSYGFIWKYKI